MKMNLDSVRSEIEAYIKDSGFVLFRGLHRTSGELLEVQWDTRKYPEARDFLDTAKALGVKMIVLHHREFSSELVEDALEQLSAAGLEYEDQRGMESRLRELSMFDGFTCQVQLSFDFEHNTYLFDLQTEWFEEINALLDTLEDLSGSGGEEDDTLGGYYSKN
jgi:hypothetical protein